MAKVKIQSDTHGRGRVWIDGEEIKNVRSVNAFVGVDLLNTVQVEFYADQVEVEAVETDIERKEIEHEQKQK